MKKLLAFSLFFILLVPGVLAQDPTSLGSEEPPYQKPRYYHFSNILVIAIISSIALFAFRMRADFVTLLLSMALAIIAFSATAESLYLYDIHASSYSLPFSNYFSDCISYGGKIYCIGVPSGSWPYTCEGECCRQIWVYDGQWTMKKVLEYPFLGTSCAAVGGKIYCLGGGTWDATHNKVLVYDPSSNSVVYKELPVNISLMTCVPYDGYIYCLGGQDWGYNESGAWVGVKERYNYVWKYDPSANSFTAVKTVQFYDLGYTIRIGAAVYNGYIYFGAVPCFQYKYDPSTDTLTQISNCPYVHWSHLFETDCPVINGKAYCYQDIALWVTDFEEESSEKYYVNAYGHKGYSVVYWNGKLCKIYKSNMYCFSL